MKVYKTRESGFKELKKQVARRTLPMYVIIIIVASTIGIFTDKNGKADIGTTLIIIAIMCCLFGYTFYRSLTRLKASYDSYSLTISSVTIIRDEDGKPPLSLYLSEIKEIIKTKTGAFIIKGRDAGDVIGVPAQMEDYDELESALQQIIPINYNPPKNSQYKTILLTVLSLGSMATVATVTNKIIVAVCAIIFLSISIWSFYKILSTKDIDAKVKRSSWWLILVIASIAYIAVLKIFIM